VKFFINDENRLKFTGNFATNRQRALENSIKKWRFIVNYIEAGGYPPHDGGLKTCNLCALYFEKDCEGCPVNFVDDHVGCDDTPYMQYNDLSPRKEALTAAKEELAFLESLRKLKKG
jgi:hypothetical protein